MEGKLEDLILELVADFENTIPVSEPERENLVEEFKNYLYLTVKTIKESEHKFIKKDENFIMFSLRRRANELNNKDTEYLKRFLLVDSSFEEIRSKSIKIFEMAKKAMTSNKGNPDIDIQGEMEKMQNLLKSVKEYNKQQAEEMISEAIVDMNYIANPSEDALSLRLYEFKRMIDSKETER